MGIRASNFQFPTHGIDRKKEKKKKEEPAFFDLDSFEVT